MKRLLTLLSVSTILATVLVLYSKPGSSLAPSNSAPLAIGDEDDPDERMEYDLMRLQDPATGEIPKNIRAQEIAYAATLPQTNTFYNGRIAAVWTPRGPFNVGGKTRALGIDISNENTILAGNTSGGIWKTTNGGTSWMLTNQLINASCLAQDKRTGKTSTWYSGSGELYTGTNGNFFIGNGIYKSNDGGNTWNLLTSTASNTPDKIDKGFDVVWDIAVAPWDTIDAVYAAAYGGVYKSVNGGTTWGVVRGSATVSAGSEFTDVAITSKGVIYATLSSESAQKGIWRSLDGITWTDITPSAFPSSYKRIVIGISPSDENQVYFLGETPGGGLAIKNFLNTTEYTSFWKYTYLSGDGSGTGGTWDDRSLNLPTAGNSTDKFYSQGSYDLVLKVKPDNPNVVFIGGTNLYRSDNGFATNTQTTRMGGYALGSGPPSYPIYPNHHPDQHALAFFPSDPNKLLSGCDGGVFKTLDNLNSNITWTSLNNGYVTTQFYTTAIDHSKPGDDRIIGGAQDNGTWFTNSPSTTATWTHPNGGDGSYCAIANGGADYYFSIQNSKITKASVDNNGNRLAYRRIDPIGGKGYLFVNPFVLDPNNNNIMYMAGGRYLWRNSDLSQIPLSNANDSISTNWSVIDSLPSGIACITACNTPTNRLYIGLTSQRAFRVDNANTSTPTLTEITWKKPITLFPQGYISSIAVDPTNGDRAIVAFSNYNIESLFYTPDGGLTWSKITGNLKKTNGPAALWVSILPVGTDTAYFAGTTAGLFATNHLSGSTTTWIQQGASTIGNAVVSMIDTRPTDGLVVASTHGAGMFSAHITDISMVVTGTQAAKAPQKFSLTNYPNPFHEYTNIEFVLDKPGKVSLQVFDTNGRTVEDLIENELPSGKHIYSYSTKSLSPGIYFYHLKAGDTEETRRMVYLK